jgi:ABC-type nitrate/sulfonate/bicarbonate transport system permease component
MIPKVERFWITFILRFAIGFLFLFAAISQFRFGPEQFANQLSTSFQNTWLGDIQSYAGVDFAKGFLQAVPYILAGLSVPILTGIWLRPALRLGALLLVMMGLGNYIKNDLANTAADFLFALIICIGLFFLSLERQADLAARSYARGEVAA